MLAADLREARKEINRLAAEVDGLRATSLGSPGQSRGQASHPVGGVRDLYDVDCDSLSSATRELLQAARGTPSEDSESSTDGALGDDDEPGTAPTSSAMPPPDSGHDDDKLTQRGRQRR